MYFDDFAIDQVFTSRGRTVTESDIVQFAGLTGDFSELHTNEEVARQSSFGRRIAHGALTFALSLGLTVRSGILDDSLIALYRVDALRFTNPVFIGDTISVTKRVEAVDAKGTGRGLVTFHTRVLNQHGRPVVEYRDALLVRAKGAPA